MSTRYPIEPRFPLKTRIVPMKFATTSTHAIFAPPKQFTVFEDTPSSRNAIKLLDWQCTWRTVLNYRPISREPMPNSQLWLHFFVWTKNFLRCSWTWSSESLLPWDTPVFSFWTTKPSRFTQSIDTYFFPIVAAKAFTLPLSIQTGMAYFAVL